MASVDLLSLVALVKRHQVEMCRDRGYELTEDEGVWLGMTRESATERLRSVPNDGLIFELEATYTQPEPRWVYYDLTPEAFNVDAYKRMTEFATLFRRPMQRMILVCYETPTNVGWDALNALQAEVWTFAQLAVNVTRTFLFQEHTPLTNDERITFFSTMKIDPIQLPFMYVTDPVARWYDFRVGQIIRIRRTNIIASAGPGSVFYRRVVPASFIYHATKVGPSDLF